jgi:hypothetical protein
MGQICSAQLHWIGRSPLAQCRHGLLAPRHVAHDHITWRPVIAMPPLAAESLAGAAARAAVLHRWRDDARAYHQAQVEGRPVVLLKVFDVMRARAASPRRRRRGRGPARLEEALRFLSDNCGLAAHCPPPERRLRPPLLLPHPPRGRLRWHELRPAPARREPTPTRTTRRRGAATKTQAPPPMASKEESSLMRRALLDSLAGTISRGIITDSEGAGGLTHGHIPRRRIPLHVIKIRFQVVRSGARPRELWLASVHAPFF